MDDKELYCIVNDKAYISQLLGCKNANDLYSSLISKGIDVSLQQSENIFTSIQNYKKDYLQELNDNDLSDLTGGSGWSKFGKVVSIVPYYTGYVIGKAPAIGLVIYSAIKGAKEQIKGIN